MVTVMIADDHALIRRVVREIIERAEDMELVAEACNGREAEQQAALLQPDVVLMDIDMPDGNGFEATERVLASSSHSRVIMLTASEQEQWAFHAIQRGAIGYLTKDIEPEMLIEAIRSAARNEICIPGPLAARILAHLRMLTLSGRLHESAHLNMGLMAPALGLTYSNGSGQVHLARPLTERESEVLDLIRKGRKNREIAQELEIAESTVHKHIQNIFEKLHARSRTEAIYLTSAGERTRF